MLFANQLVVNNKWTHYSWLRICVLKWELWWTIPGLFPSTAPIMIAWRAERRMTCSMLPSHETTVCQISQESQQGVYLIFVINHRMVKVWQVTNTRNMLPYKQHNWAHIMKSQGVSRTNTILTILKTSPVFYRVSRPSETSGPHNKS